MIKVKNTLSPKDKQQVNYILQELVDIYGDFYITKDNLRLYIKENLPVLYKLLSKGDYVIFDEGMVAVVTGYAEKKNRKYLKIITENNQLADKLVKNIVWEIQDDLYIKIKKNNPIKEVLLKNNFKFLGDRGKEILLVRKRRY